MELLFWSLVGGIVGTVFMDIADKFMERTNFTSGAACGGPRALGRWFLGMLSGRFVHENIIESSPVKNEVPAGWIFHYVLGAGVALTYPLFYLVLNVPMPGNHLVPGLVWGLATTVLPWFTNFPGFGWGFFGLRAPKGMRSLMAPAIGHACYGLGLGLVLTMTVARQVI
ncbi:MAG: DUF2938 family protein [Woeseiaceae bacterium]|nr:DUF2938 family protein [Woeseiaceae bacterium]